MAEENLTITGSAVARSVDGQNKLLARLSRAMRDAAAADEIAPRYAISAVPVDPHELREPASIEEPPDAAA